MKLAALDLGIVGVYLAGMLAVGAWVARRIGSFDDFFIAGRRMTTPVLVCTLVSTYYGLDVTFGGSETAYLEGVSAFVVYSAPFYVAYVGMAVLVAPRLRALPVRSLPEAIGHFYGRDARIAAALASFVYSAPILSVAGMGVLGEFAFGWPAWLAATLFASVALTYTVLGGLLADAITDAFQFTVMCTTLALGGLVAMLQVGGPDVLARALPAESFAPLGSLSASEIAIYASIALTPLVEPAFYQRTLAALDVRQVVRALLIGLVLWMAYDWLVVYLGLTGQVLVAQGALPADLDPSAVLLHTLGSLLPVGLLGLFLAGCLAAAMSTLDSYALIAAGNLVYDGWQPLSRGRLSDRQLLRWTRIATLPTVGVSLVLALGFERLRDAWIFMASVLLSTVLVPMAMALFVLRRPSPRAGSLAAWAGLLSSLGLFAGFLGAGVEVDDTLRLNLFGGSLLREEALLITLPLSLAAFGIGHVRDRRARERA